MKSIIYQSYSNIVNDSKEYLTDKGNQAINYKLKGNSLFKKSKYPQAIEEYTKVTLY